MEADWPEGVAGQGHKRAPGAQRQHGPGARSAEKLLRARTRAHVSMRFTSSWISARAVKAEPHHLHPGGGERLSAADGASYAVLHGGAQMRIRTLC